MLVPLSPSASLANSRLIEEFKSKFTIKFQVLGACPPLSPLTPYLPALLWPIRVPIHIWLPTSFNWIQMFQYLIWTFFHHLHLMNSGIIFCCRPKLGIPLTDWKPNGFIVLIFFPKETKSWDYVSGQWWTARSRYTAESWGNQGFFVLKSRGFLATKEKN